MLSRSADLWSFASEVYTNFKVSSASLELQDSYDVNVPLLLFCCWSAWRYGELPDADINKIVSYSESWSSLTVMPLRQIRQNMKVNMEASSIISKQDWFELREDIKRLELASEKLLLNGLAKTVEHLPLRVGDVDVAIVNIQRCLEVSDEHALQLIAKTAEIIFE